MENVAALSINPPSSIFQPPTSSFNRRLRSLADMRGVWSLGDQAILSLGNFLTNLFLLRSKIANQWFGNYYIVLSFILYLNNLHMALVTYPISITSAGITDSELRRRVRRAIGMTLLLAIPESIAIAWGTVITVNWHLVPWVVSALIFWQLQETVRRSLMARLEHRRAMFGDAVSYLGQAAILWFILHHARFNISIEAAFGIIGGTAAVGFVIQAIQLRLFVPSDSPQIHTVGHQSRIHWTLGRWILLGNITNLLTIYSIPWVMRYSHGQVGATMYAAVLQVLNASNPLLAAVANLITPVVANAKAHAESIGETGEKQSKSAAVKYSVQGAVLLFPFFVVLMVVPALILRIFYGHQHDDWPLSGPMRIFAFTYGMMYISAMLNSYLCGLGKSHVPLLGQAANAVVTCAITLPLVAKFGLIGAAWGSIFPVAAQVIVGAWHTYHVRFSGPVQPDPSGRVASATPFQARNPKPEIRRKS